MDEQKESFMQRNPPIIRQDPRPGPGYDPMDRIVQDMQNILSFLSMLAQNPANLNYLETHLSQILGLRRGIAQQIEQLSNDPYSYSPSRLQLLQKENERIFSYIEGVIGSMNPWNQPEFERFQKACGQAIAKFDGDLTP